MSYHKFINDVGIIGITTLITSVGGFILLPIITKTLGAYDYGIWAQIVVTAALLSPLALLGQSMSIVRFLSAEKDEAVIRESFYSILFFVGFTSLLTGIGVIILSDWIAALIFQDPQASFFVKMGAVLIFFTAVNTITLFYFRIFRQTVKYALFNILQTVGLLVFILLFIYSGFKIEGVIFAAILLQVLLFFATIFVIISQIGFAVPKFSKIHEFLKYGIPLTPNSLIRWVTASSDRYLIAFFIGVNAVGIYAAAYTIGNLNHFLLTPLQIILFPALSKLYDEDKHSDVKKILQYSIKYYLLIAIPWAFGISILAEPILRILTTPEFISGSVVIPLIVLSGVSLGIYQICINVTHLVKKTQYNIVILSIGAALSICFNLFLIPKYGIFGAAVSNFLAYGIMAIITVLLSMKFIRFHFDLSFLIKSILSSLVMIAAIRIYNPQSLHQVLISVVFGAAIYFLLLYILHGIDQKEITFFKKYFEELKKTLRGYYE